MLYYMSIAYNNIYYYDCIIDYLMFYRSLLHAGHMLGFVLFLTYYLLCFAFILYSSRDFLIIVFLRMLYVLFMVIRYI